MNNSEGQTQEPCNGNCGMNYCDEYGCIENKPEGDISHLLTPPPIKTEGEDEKDLTDIRNKLFHAMPSGDIKAWDLILIIKDHLKQLDEYIDRSAPPSPVGIDELVKALEYIATSKASDLRWAIGQMQETAKTALSNFKADAASLPSSSVTGVQVDEINKIADVSIEYCDKYLAKGVLDFNSFKQSFVTIKRLASSLPVTGESEAIGERTFTLKEMREAFCYTYDVGKIHPGNNRNKDEKEYFKSKFGITI